MRRQDFFSKKDYNVKGKTGGQLFALLNKEELYGKIFQTEGEWHHRPD